MSELERLIQENHLRDPNFRGGLSNHLPMALIALDALNASDEHLCNFADKYAKMLEPLQIDGIDRQDLFQRLRRDGVDLVLRQELNELTSGLGGDAFHGWIRTAHAVQFYQKYPSDTSLHEIAHALAYLRRRRLVFAGVSQGVSLSASELFDQLIAVQVPVMNDGTITPRMTKAMESLDVQRVAAQVPKDGLAGIAEVALVNFLKNKDFASLHLVTGVHASRVLAPWVEPALLVSSTWKAVVAVLAFVAPDRGEVPAGNLPDWAEICSKASVSFNDHVVKLVQAAREEASEYPTLEVGYRAIASRAVG